MNCLVTGGAGFIGSHLTEALIADGHSVSVIDDLSTGSLQNLTSVKNHPAFSLIQGNMLNAPELPALVQQSDVIFHLAAAVGVELVVHDPIRTITTNVFGTERVLSLASQYGKRILIASTSEVYGKSDKIPFHETDDLLIGSPKHSRWSYACSKLLDEFMLMAHVRSHALPGTVVRFFNTVGPRQTGRYGMVIPRFVSAALQGQPLRVYGSGGQTRCFCHVFDTVRALRVVAQTPSTCGEILNIGNTESITIYNLAKRIISRLGSSSEIEMIPYEQAYEVGFEDMIHRSPCCEKILNLCGWQAEIPLNTILDDVAAYLRQKL